MSDGRTALTGDSGTSDATAQTGEISGVSIGFTPGLTPPVTPPATATSTAFEIPDAYKEEPWVQNILKTDPANHKEEFFKAMKGAQALLGKRPELQVPGKDATPEQIKNFHKQLGVPDDANGYQIKPIEWSEEDKAIGAFINSSRTESFMADIKTEAHKLGITPSQLQGLADAYDKNFVKHHRDTVTATMTKEAETEKNFDEVATTLFGEAKLTVLNNAKKMMENNVPAEVKPYLAKLDNESLLVLASVLNGVSKRYVKEDGLNTGGAPTGMNADQIRQEGQKMMMSDAYRDVMHPDHERMKNAVKAHYARLPR